ncbi:MAG: phytanoyl-CoA dioxygenase family protein [Rhodobacteraceae bacterium]|nr:phytanoyl-CoA dioxygenase family protein [Paracoccaceae bacterium]
MPLNSTPLRPISDDDITAYDRDGVVCLRNVLDPEWIETLLPIAKRVVVDKEDFGLLPTYPGRYMTRTVPEVRSFVFNSPLAEICARVLQSREVRFFFDEIFAKPPRSQEQTIWHTDRMGWPVAGKMVPSLWVPLSPIAKSDCLECVAGSHTQDIRYWLFSPNARQMIKPPDRASHPDGEKLRADPANRFLQWDMEPGDMLVVHPWTIHYSHGNGSDDWRFALSVRMFGDDITWAPRPDCVNLAGVSFDEMIAGEKPRGPLFPLLWSADGRRDGDADFPRGFATAWSAKRRDEVNYSKTFMELQKKEAAE